MTAQRYLCPVCQRMRLWRLFIVPNGLHTVCARCRPSWRRGEQEPGALDVISPSRRARQPAPEVPVRVIRIRAALARAERALARVRVPREIIGPARALVDGPERKAQARVNRLQRRLALTLAH